MTRLPRMQTDLAKVTTALFAAVLMLLAAPMTMIQSTSQAAATTTASSGQQGILVETTESISASITTPVQDLFGDTVLLNQVITWHPNGTTSLTDDLGRSFSFGVDTSDGSFTLLRDGPVVIQRITGNGLSYDVKWTPVENQDGLVEKYKFTIVGQSEKGHKIKLPIKTDMKGLSDRGNRLTASGVHSVVNSTGGDSGGLGIDWSDAIAAGYRMGFDRSARAITVDVGKAFDVDPTTVDTLSTTLSPATADYFEGEKRMVNVAGTVYVFYYDGANLAYKYSTDGGNTWSSKLSSSSGTLNGDSHRWTVVNTKVGSTNYVALLYFKLNGANTDFYAKRGTTSGGSITWSSATLLFSKANNAGCSSSVCAAATATTDTSGAVFAAFRYLASGQASYQYRILKSTDGGLTWTTSLAEASSGSSTRISMAMTNLASGRVLFAYGKYNTSELTYRTFSGTSWSAEATTSGAGMTANTVKQLSADSDSSNMGYVAYLVNAPPSTVKLAKWTSTGSLSAFETPPSGSLTHSLPSISIAEENYIHIYTIASSKVYETKKVGSTWKSPNTQFGTVFTSPNQLTAGFSRASGVWIEGAASPWSIRYEQNSITLDPGYGCGSKNWGTSNYNNGSSTPNGVFGQNTSCSPVGSAIGGRTNYVRLEAQLNAASFDVAYQDSKQGCSPWNTCDKPVVAGDNNNGADSQVHNDQFYDDNPVQGPLPATLDYTLSAQYWWYKNPTPTSSTGQVQANLLTNIWFVNTADGRDPTSGLWKTVIVIDFLWDRLTPGPDGYWRQDPNITTDRDSCTPGIQYYGIYRDPTSNGQTIYHYNIVLENDGITHVSDTWYADTEKIGTIINNALTQDYRLGWNGSCPGQVPPGTPSNYQILDQESGIEVHADSKVASNGGIARVAFSQSGLSYN